MYDLILDEEVIKKLNKLPKLIKKRIFQKLIKTKEKPFNYFIKLKDRNEYKLRIGKYRVIADIKDNQIFIVHVDLRKRVYKYPLLF